MKSSNNMRGNNKKQSIQPFFLESEIQDSAKEFQDFFLESEENLDSNPFNEITLENHQNLKPQLPELKSNRLLKLKSEWRKFCLDAERLKSELNHDELIYWLKNFLTNEKISDCLIFLDQLESFYIRECENFTEYQAVMLNELSQKTKQVMDYCHNRVDFYYENKNRIKDPNFNIAENDNPFLGKAQDFAQSDEELEMLIEELTSIHRSYKQMQKNASALHFAVMEMKHFLSFSNGLVF